SRLPAIAVGAKESHDLDAAKKAATVLDLPLTVYEISEEEIPDALSLVVPLIPKKTSMDAEIAVTEYFVCRCAKDAGFDTLLTGQGADELFGGYARYGSSAHLREDLDADLAVYPVQQKRDFAAASLSGIRFLQPFMDKRVVAAASVLTEEELVSGDLRKIALRRAAETWLPHDLAWKPKKAMQYGSGVSKMIAKLAKKENTNPQKYIEQFVEVK
ncbi:MAG TPA: asparagine synthase-related protein, partial [Methanocorpusculum sp.]|nr:asparagine synthase-related protein [Methanocorpusculum sp.]